MTNDEKLDTIVNNAEFLLNNKHQRLNTYNDQLILTVIPNDNSLNVLNAEFYGSGKLETMIPEGINLVSHYTEFEDSPELSIFIDGDHYEVCLGKYTDELDILNRIHEANIHIKTLESGVDVDTINASKFNTLEETRLLEDIELNELTESLQDLSEQKGL